MMCDEVDDIGDPPNGGHRFGLSIGCDEYYWADAIRVNEFGNIEWYCQYPNHDRYGRMTQAGSVQDYRPRISLGQFRELSGGVE